MYKSIVEGKGGITAKVVADSTSNDVRLTTLELRYPRFIHSEFMTHRMFSRNASSSRAIPVKKMIEQVDNDPAAPIHWGANQPGMQARVELPDYKKSRAQGTWSRASQVAKSKAITLDFTGAHKQIVNRILEPFQFISVVVTATEWDNFFKLRLHEDAQPEIYELARVMKQAMEESEPTLLGQGQYHVPYTEYGHTLAKFQSNVEEMIKASVARCARVSYLNHDNSEPNMEKDIKLHDQLLNAGHMSPFEHIATPMNTVEAFVDYEYVPYHWQDGVTHMDKYDEYWSGNLRGWIQYRQLV